MLPEGCCWGRLAYSAVFVLFKHHHLGKLCESFLVKQLLPSCFLFTVVVVGGGEGKSRKEKKKPSCTVAGGVFLSSHC